MMIFSSQHRSIIFNSLNPFFLHNIYLKNPKLISISEGSFAYYTPIQPIIVCEESLNLVKFFELHHWQMYETEQKPYLFSLYYSFFINNIIFS
jgi:hypothetical protein